MLKHTPAIEIMNITAAQQQHNNSTAACTSWAKHQMLNSDIVVKLLTPHSYC